MHWCWWISSIHLNRFSAEEATSKANLSTVNLCFNNVHNQSYQSEQFTVFGSNDEQVYEESTSCGVISKSGANGEKTIHECEVKENFAKVNQSIEDISAQASSNAKSSAFTFPAAVSYQPNDEGNQQAKEYQSSFLFEHPQFEEFIQVDNSSIIGDNVNEEKNQHLSEKILDDLFKEISKKSNETTNPCLNPNFINNNELVMCNSQTDEKNQVLEMGSIIEELFDLTKHISTNSINTNTSNATNNSNLISLTRQQSSFLSSVIDDFENENLDFCFLDNIMTKSMDPMISTNMLIK